MHRGGEPRDRARPADSPDRAWTGTGECQGLCAADPTAAHRGSAARPGAECVPGASRSGGAPADAAGSATHTGGLRPGLWTGEPAGAAARAARAPARPEPVTARLSGGVSARGRDAGYEAFGSHFA